MMFTLQNEAKQPDIFEDWTVRLNGVLLVRTPSYAKAKMAWWKARRVREAFDVLTAGAAIDLCQELTFAIDREPAEAVAKAEELLRLTKAAVEFRELNWLTDKRNHD